MVPIGPRREERAGRCLNRKVEKPLRYAKERQQFMVMGILLLMTILIPVSILRLRPTALRLLDDWRALVSWLIGRFAENSVDFR
jgi:hypothetical protein